jgi:hypothetical protein
VAETRRLSPYSRPAGYARPVTPGQEQRLKQAARDAHAAEVRGDDAAANEAWRRYRLIQDASRDPDELLAEGIALSNMAMELAGADRALRP